MKSREKRIKQHIISLRVSNEEWKSLHEVMEGLQYKRVSDLMREAFRQILVPPTSYPGSLAKGQERVS